MAVTTLGKTPSNVSPPTWHRFLTQSSFKQVGLFSLLLMVFGGCESSTGISGVDGDAAVDLSTARLSLVSGDDQEGTVGETAPDALTVQVVDTDGSGIGGVTVDWVFAQGMGRGSVNSPLTERVSTTTDQQGNTSVRWALGPRAGTQRATAEISLPATATGDAAGAPRHDTGKRVGFVARVRPSSPESVTVEPTSVLIESGEQIVLSATVTDQFGNVVEDVTVEWSSTDPGIASVEDSTGVLHGLSEGSTSVTATTGSVTGEASVGVEEAVSDPPPDDSSPEVGTLTVSPSYHRFTEQGAPLQLTVTAQGPDGREIDDPYVTWRSSNEEVASVDSMGRVTARGAGTAFIIASSICCTAGSAAVVGPSDPSSSDIGTWRGNEPAAWVTHHNLDFVGATASLGADPTWWGLDNADFGGRGGTFASAPGQRMNPYIDPGVSSPLGGTGLVYFYPAGMADGQANGTWASSRLSAGGGVYVATTFRQSANWQQNESERNVFKHLIVWASSGGEEPVMIARSGIHKIPNDAQDRYRMSIGLYTGSADQATHTRDETGFWNAGDWVQVEILVRLNSGGANTGSVAMWVNGSLQAYADALDVPFDRAVRVRGTLVHGGGIGNVPNDQEMAFGEIYISTER